MTKEGWKQILVSIDTWNILKQQSENQGISINRLISDRFMRPVSTEITNLSLCQAEPPRLIKKLSLLRMESDLKASVNQFYRSTQENHIINFKRNAN